MGEIDWLQIRQACIKNVSKTKDIKSVKNRHTWITHNTYCLVQEIKNEIVVDPKLDVLQKFGNVYYYDDADWIPPPVDKNVDVVHYDNDKEILWIETEDWDPGEDRFLDFDLNLFLW